jgi:hypothetical protein
VTDSARKAAAQWLVFSQTIRRHDGIIHFRSTGCIVGGIVRIDNGDGMDGTRRVPAT